MTQNAEQTAATAKWFIIAGFAVAMLAGYWVLTRVLWLDLDTQRRIAAVFGTAGLTVGALWIAALVASKHDDQRARWFASVGPFGVTQAFAGISLLLWATGFTRLWRLAADATIACLFISVVLTLWRVLAKR